MTYFIALASQGHGHLQQFMSIASEISVERASQVEQVICHERQRKKYWDSGGQLKTKAVHIGLSSGALFQLKEIGSFMSIAESVLELNISLLH